MRISDRIKNMRYSAVRKLVPLATEAEKQGIKVYRLNIGQPNIETPKLFFDGLKNIPDHVIRYADSRGINELLEQVIEVYKRDGHHLKKEDIIVTEGGSEALTFISLGICNPGDEVLIPEPFFSNYRSFLVLAGAKVVPIPTDIEKDFALPSKEEIQKLITDKTKMIWYSNPCNPTGKVYSKEEVEMLADLAIENDLFVVADEPYREFIYDDSLKHFSILDVERAKDHVIVVDSVSKHYSACGARVGFLISKNEEFMTYIMKFCQARLAAPTVEQYAVASLMKADKEYFKSIKEIYNRRRNIIVNSLNNIEGVTCSAPKGAIYAFAKLPIDSSEEFCKWLLTDFRYDNSTVMLAPGEGFYATEGMGKQEVRFSFCVGEEDIEKAMKVLEEALKVYKK